MRVRVPRLLERCPGSHTAPYALVNRERSVRRARVMVDSYGICQYCRREYYVLGNGTLHVHNGLPKPDDGRCPYRCPPDCDFDCYFPTAGGSDG